MASSYLSGAIDLGAKKNLAEVSAFLGSTHERLSDLAKIEISSVTSDSKQVTDGALFIALSGERHHGAEFFDQVQGSGAAAILTDQRGEELIASQHSENSQDLIPVIVVSRPDIDLGHLAHWFYGNPMRSIYAAGITGTNGKTTTTTLLHQIWSEARVSSGLIGTIATRYAGMEFPAVRTTPSADEIARTIAEMSALHVRNLAMEVSSHGLALHRINGAKFAAAGFTNLSKDHLDFHHDMESYYQAKAELFTHEYSSIGFINIDNSYGERLARESEIQVLALSTKNKKADWHIVSAARIKQGYQLAIRGIGGVLIETELALLGRHNLENYLLALAIAFDSGVDPLLLAEITPMLKGAEGRLERINLGQEFSAYVDYAHTPDAVARILSSLREDFDGRIIGVLGCGGDRDKSKRADMGAALLQGCDIAIFTSDNPRSEDPDQILVEMTTGLAFANPSRIIRDRREAIRYALSQAGAGDLVIVLGKGHESGQIFADEILPFDDRIELARGIESLS
jgi:UDP-N-acetylmuramoyl-L-alanyl-D-glutamate--2,6-diaminopimelate ligase